MAIPAIIAAAMRAATMLGAEAGGAGAAVRGAGGLGSMFASSGSGKAAASGLGTAEKEAAQRTGQFSNNLKDLNQQFAFVNYNVHAFTRYVHDIPAKFVATATFAIDALAHAAQPFVNLVGRNNPAVTKQWELALNDAYGFIGRSLIPIVQAFTHVARGLGDAMAGLEPVFQPAIASLGKLVGAVGDNLAEAIRDNVPLFETLAGALKAVADSATFTIKALGWLGRTTREALSFVGLAGGPGLASAALGQPTSMGAGIRSSRQVGNADELQNELIKNALMTGAGSGETKEDRQVSVMQKVYDKISDLYDLISDNIPDAGGIREGAMSAVEGAAAAGPAQFAANLAALLRTS